MIYLSPPALPSLTILDVHIIQDGIEEVLERQVRSTRSAIVVVETLGE